MKINIRNYDNATILLTIMNRLCGLRMIEYPQGRPRVWFSFAYLVLLLALFNASTKLHNLFHEAHDLLSVERGLYQFMVYMHTFAVTFLTLLGWMHSEMFLMYKKELAHVERYLRQFRPINYLRLFIRITVVMVAYFIFMFIAGTLYIGWLLNHTSFGIAVLIVITYSYGSTVGSVVLLDFAISLSWLTAKFKMVNDLLREEFLLDEFRVNVNKPVDKGTDCPGRLFENTVRQQFLIGSSIIKRPYGLFRAPLRIPVALESGNEELIDNRKIELLRATRRSHLKLCKMSKLLSAMFRTQMALEVRVAIMYLTASIYYLYIAVNKSNSWLTDTIQLAFLTILESLSHCIKVMLVGRACENASREAEKTFAIIHACSKPDSNREVKQEIRQFALQMSQCHFRLSAHFNMNYNFVRECLGSVVTYLAIIIQMTNQTELKRGTIQVTENATGY